MNLIYFTFELYLKLLITSFLTLPLAVSSKPSKILSSLSDDVLEKAVQRQERQFNISRPVFLYARHTRKFVKVASKKVNALTTKEDKYAELIMTTRGLRGQLSIQGKHTKKYVCMNGKGRIKLEKTFREVQCMFYLGRHSSGYVTFRLVSNETRYLGFKKSGETKLGHRTASHHHAAWLMIEHPVR